MRVLTFNLWGRRGDWEARRTLLAATLGELEPDLVVLQEAVVTEEYDQAAELLGEGYRIVHQSEREPGAEGVERGQGASIASRWPLEAVREVDLHVTPRTAGFACTTLIVEVEAPVGPLLLANHLPSWQLDFERERELQALEAARALDGLAGDRHVVLAGDFTADPDAASVRFLTGRQSLDGTSVCYRDAWASVHDGEAGDTFTPANPLVGDWDWPSRRLDYVLVRCGEHGGPTLQITSCERVLDRPVAGVWASDHFGIVANLEPPQGR